MMRAKMRVATVTEMRNITADGEGEKYTEQLQFSAVAKSEAYPADGSDENNTFAKWTPTATLNMDVRNPALWGKFKPGDTFYVDFTPADVEAQLPKAHSAA